MAPLPVAQVLTVYQVLCWALPGILFAGLVLSVCLLVKKEEDPTKPTPLRNSLIILLVIFQAVAIVGIVVESSFPECPICEKTVKADFCPDCGWESIGVVFDVPPLYIAIFLVFQLFIVYIAMYAMKPQCPNCEKKDSSGDACDEEVVVGPAFVCPRCGLEWNPADCGDCGTQMDAK